MLGAIASNFLMGFAYIHKHSKTNNKLKPIIGIAYLIILMTASDMFWPAVLAGLIFVFILGMAINIKMLPDKFRRERLNDLFKQIKLESVKGDYPSLIDEHETEYLKILSFRSIIPLSQWKAKHDLIESYLNVKITKIINADNDNNIVHVHTVKQPLPDMIEWDDGYITEYPEWLSVGVSYDNWVLVDLNRNPHTFITGETGSGKSNILKCLIYQCLYKGHIVKLIDFKRGVSFSLFDEMVEIYSDYDKVKAVLAQLIAETNHRLDLLKAHRVESIEQYNIRANNKLKRIVVFIDELAELVKASDKETARFISNSLETLTRLSRAAGINLIMGIQRPDAKIIDGQIKNNVSLRICGRFVDPEPSRIILGNDEASKLPNIKGRFIFKDDEQKEFQAFYITDGLIYALPYDHPHIVPRRIKEENNQEVQKEPEVNNTPSIDFNFSDINIS